MSKQSDLPGIKCRRWFCLACVFIRYWYSDPHRELFGVDTVWGKALPTTWLIGLVEFVLPRKVLRLALLGEVIYIRILTRKS